MSNHNTQGKVSVGVVLLLGILAALAIMFFLNMSKEDDAKNIRAVLQQNQQFGEILASRIGERADRGDPTEEDLERTARYYDEYVAQLQKIDTHACPRDFAESFYRYIAAYEDAAQVAHAHPHMPSDEQMLAANVQDGLEGEPGKQVRELKAQFEAWVQKRREKSARANQAEQDMKAIATRYGAL